MNNAECPPPAKKSLSAFSKKIAEAMQEEEIDIYALSLYCMSSDDLSFFSEVDRARVEEIFRILIADTKMHTQLLKQIFELGSRA